MFKVLGWLTWLLIRIVLCIIFYGTPLIGLWVASSLAAYFGGPQWMAWAAGALLFPIIPGLWELHAYSHRKPDSKPWFTVADRVSMRTFVVGLVFLVGLLYFYPQMAFVALSTRGDWMLDPKDPRAQQARPYLLASANGLEWLYRASRTNRFKSQVDKQSQERAEEAARQVEQQLAKQREEEAAKKQAVETAKADEKETANKDEKETASTDEKGTDKKQDPEETAQIKPEPATEEKTSESDKKQEIAQTDQDETAHKQDQPVKPVVVSWPWKQNGLHPAIAKMPPSVETSIQSVADYIDKQEHDPVLRIKALHDYVADRIAYDSDAFYSGNFPDQEAETVFATKKGVCAGYANLLSALATAMHEEVVVVLGDVRDPYTGDKLVGEGGHAWNAARIGGRWYLIDATWDAGSISREKGFTKHYKTDYLLTPARVMIWDHFPDDLTWQLLAQPVSLGEFLRQPMLRPAFETAGLQLVAPSRTLNESGARAFATVKNPKSEWLMAALETNGQKIGEPTMPVNNKLAQLDFQLPQRGRYRLNMYANERRDGSYRFVGSVDFVNR